MKLPLFLLLLAIVSCVHRDRKYPVASEPDIPGRLSDISPQVIAIPLETTIQCRIEALQQVRRDGKDVFIRNGNWIYRFDITGRFRKLIPIGTGRPILDFALCPARQWLIALDCAQQLYYYTYEGRELLRQDMGSGKPWQTVLSIACHAEALWVVAENLSVARQFETRVCKMTFSGEVQENHLLTAVEPGRFSLPGSQRPELSVAGGRLYAYAPFSPQETILRDTLWLLSRNHLPSIERAADRLYMYPLHEGRRFLVASCRTNVATKENYLFVYDRKQHTSCAPEGLADDFYRTGLIKDLQALDMRSHEYYFFKSSKDVSAAFPDRGEHDNPVLFIVTLYT